MGSFSDGMKMYFVRQTKHVIHSFQTHQNIFSFNQTPGTRNLRQGNNAKKIPSHRYSYSYEDLLVNSVSKLDANFIVGRSCKLTVTSCTAVVRGKYSVIRSIIIVVDALEKAKDDSTQLSSNL